MESNACVPLVPVKFQTVHVDGGGVHVDSRALHVNFWLGHVNADLLHVNARTCRPKPTDACISPGRNAQVLEKELFAEANSFSIQSLDLGSWRDASQLVPVKFETVHVDGWLLHDNSLRQHVNGKIVLVNGRML